MKPENNNRKKKGNITNTRRLNNMLLKKKKNGLKKPKGKSENTSRQMKRETTFHNLGDTEKQF